ncbi:L-rhamnose mutarotase [Yoonia sediminilitoris]|uniref:L-rhamnose mutarotase n=1 Tax=Yoonia sediminilitoris TaxID=1286148 RepID=A0A2T6K4G6_9RHOB|nr:L-rhamnose mutarotase [Yoonia sediminilitoris]PUB09549.1 L-rhamnose mutarotase [Yoonia sediminilitoris]RCW89504.1 L-rhamnose mutarotase [Yoonia sediminilitoris]
MNRRVWLMTLKPGCEAEYKARHDAIWPELLDVMAASGIRDFTIHRHGLTLIAVQDRYKPPVPSDPDPVQWKWWAAMEALMHCHSDTRPVQIEVEDVFAFHADQLSKEP